MKKNCFLWLLLIAAAALLAYSLCAVDAVGSRLQYIVESPGDAAQAAAELTALAEEWDSTQRAWALNGFIQEASMRADSQSARGRVTMIGENSPALADWTLLDGRLFTGEELTSGAPVALLDEQLAQSLFREVAVTARTFTLGGTTFRVIGVVRHTRQVGDAADYGAYIPLLCSLAPDALVAEAIPLPGAGAGASFSGVCRLWRSNGSFIDLGKEAVGATMWARALGFIAGAAALLKIVRWLKSRGHAAAAWHRQSLQRRYALQMLPQTIGVALALLLGWGAAAGAALLLLDFLLQPVYAYPECVPAVLVEWEEIRRTFWQVQQSAVAYRELRTPELLRLRYLAGLIRISCALLAALLWRLLPRTRKAR